MDTLTQKEKELIGVGASIAAGCLPCTAYHFRAARAAGASEEEISQAVDDALCVRNSASRIMAELADKLLGNVPASSMASCCTEKPLIGELVSVGAALAVNCTTNLETHLASARKAGASERQIEIAVGIARSIKKTAAQKAEETVNMAGDASSAPGNDCDDDCGCRKEQPPKKAKDATNMVSDASSASGNDCTDDCGCRKEQSPQIGKELAGCCSDGRSV